MISFPAPAICQGADEDLLIEIGAVIFPGCIKRWPGENGLRLWVEGDPTDSAARTEALAKFQTVLGVLRAWRSGAGELRDERRAGLGEGSVRDEAGNQWVMVDPALGYGIAGGEIEKLSASAFQGIRVSQNLRNALWLNGRTNRTAADFYMIYEYAEKELKGSKGIRAALGLSDDSQDRLTRSANNLSPLEGGRHAEGGAAVAMTLDEQREYVARLLRLWIARYG
jgi:hypothetical protein